MGAHPNAQGWIAPHMISLLRRFANSWIGAVILGLVLVAFVVTLYEGRSGLGLPGSGGTGLATVGRDSIPEAEATRRVQNQLDQARQEQPTLDMNAFIGAGGAEAVINRMIEERAVEAFGAKHGLIASKRLIDGEIASIPAFNGPNGQFDRTTFDAILNQRKLTEAMVRADFGRAAVSKMLLLPVAGGASTPTGLAVPYATLLLEQRLGQIAIVPAAAFASNTPISDADVATFYGRNVARYTVPELRTIKYAAFDRSRFDGKVAPSESEIAAAYKANAARYAASEQRAFTQIALYAKVKAGMTLDAAAKSVGLEALTVPASDKAAFAKLTGPKVADAAFTTPRGGLAPLAQSGLGYHIIRVDSVTGIAAKALEQARPELVAELTKTKTDQALAFDDVAQKYGLSAATTPPITASGLAPGTQGFVLPEAVKPVLRDAFQAETGDDPQVSSVGNGQAYLLYHMDRVVPAAPTPLAAIKGQVAADAMIDRAARAAKKTADGIVAAVNKGTPLSQALAGAGVALPAPKPAGGRRIDIAQARDKVPPPVLAMFSMAAKRAKVVPVENGAGWYVVYLDTVTPATPLAAQPLLPGTQAELSRSIGEEYAQQFVNAVKAEVGVKRNDGAIAALKRALTGQK
jgi:peptidyl-prolyl cis-trans isomerase D